MCVCVRVCPIYNICVCVCVSRYIYIYMCVCVITIIVTICNNMTAGNHVVFTYLDTPFIQHRVVQHRRGAGVAAVPSCRWGWSSQKFSTSFLWGQWCWLQGLVRCWKCSLIIFEIKEWRCFIWWNSPCRTGKSACRLAVLKDNYT